MGIINNWNVKWTFSLFIGSSKILNFEIEIVFSLTRKKNEIVYFYVNVSIFLLLYFFFSPLSVTFLCVCLQNFLYKLLNSTIEDCGVSIYYVPLTMCRGYSLENE